MRILNITIFLNLALKYLDLRAPQICLLIRNYVAALLSLFSATPLLRDSIVTRIPSAPNDDWKVYDRNKFWSSIIYNVANTSPIKKKLLHSGFLQKCLWIIIMLLPNFFNRVSFQNTIFGSKSLLKLTAFHKIYFALLTPLSIPMLPFVCCSFSIFSKLWIWEKKTPLTRQRNLPITIYSHCFQSV